ncbi:RelA/SpoT domain-containing protein [Achromobacter xylosoxidans]
MIASIRRFRADGMEWTLPRYTKKHVDRAGRVLAADHSSDDERYEALEVLDNWRASHNFPLNTFQIGLRKKSRDVDAGALVAQRLKRIPSIIKKLQRFPGMSLARMQDIGGCRAVLDDVRQVREVVRSYRESGIKHALVSEKDYIDHPKDSGYRGVHLVYRYNSDRNQTYNSLSVELQIRSRIQHCWATAVETMGTFLSQSLKSSEGEDDWLEFFAYTSSAFAFKEGTPALNCHPDRKRVIKEVNEYKRKLSVVEKLGSYGHALRTIEENTTSDAYYLMVLRPAAGTLEIVGYKRQDLDRATQDYIQAEQRVGKELGSEAVLVKTESIAALRSAYPNYFLDTQRFLSELADIA